MELGNLNMRYFFRWRIRKLKKLRNENTQINLSDNDLKSKNRLLENEGKVVYLLITSTKTYCMY